MFILTISEDEEMLEDAESDVSKFSEADVKKEDLFEGDQDHEETPLSLDGTPCKEDDRACEEAFNSRRMRKSLSLVRNRNSVKRHDFEDKGQDYVCHYLFKYKETHQFTYSQ